jgi:FkbM family methyltransferase
VKEAFFKGVASLLSFDDIRRSLLAILGRTKVRKVIAETAEGTFALDTRDRIISWSILVRGVWEPYESAVLSDLLRPGDVVIDAGANIGWHTVLFANRVGPSGRVIAFEPDPQNFALLKLNVALNDKANVELHNAALGERNEPLNLVLNAENFGDHHVAFNGAAGGEQNVSVQGVRLDDIAANVANVRLLKIDCQGAEPSILRGGLQTLRKCEYVVTEFWPSGLRRAGFSPGDYLNLLKSEFAYFRRVREGSGETFQPIGEIDKDAASIDGPEGKNDATDYLLRRRSA